MNSINNYAKELVKDFSLEGLPEKEQAEALNMIIGRLNRAVVAATLKMLTPDQKTRFAAALGNPQTMDTAISEITAEVPNLHQVLEEVIAEEYEIIKSAMKA